jgi:hypothetical protein
LINQKNNKQFQISQTQIRFTQINNKLRIQTILWDLCGGGLVMVAETTISFSFFSSLFHFLVVLGSWFVDDFGLIEGGGGNDDGLCLIVSGVVGIGSGGVDLRLKMNVNC